MTLLWVIFLALGDTPSYGQQKWGLELSIVLVLYIPQLFQRHTWGRGLSRLCFQRVIWRHRTLFFDSLDTQKFRSGFAEDDFS